MTCCEVASVAVPSIALAWPVPCDLVPTPPNITFISDRFIAYKKCDIKFIIPDLAVSPTIEKKKMAVRFK